MASAIEDTFFDFDVNFLQQTPVNPEILGKLDKYRKSILVLKKKTIATNSLIQKYYAKREQLDLSERNVVASKQECQTICIDYSNALETCNKLENDLQILQNRNKELEEKCFNAENQCIAIKSHANQLQQLAKEHESQIKALKLKSKSCKTSVKPSDKINEKQLKTLNKENNTLRKHITLFRDVLLGKRKLKHKYKILLQKYKDYDGSCSDSDEETGCEDYEFSSPPSPICMKDDPQVTNNEQVLKAQISPKEIIHIKMNDGNDILEMSKRNENDGSSVDTGRGSSLACSDSEKFIQSPSYFLNDSPLSDISPLSRLERQCADVATSPIFILETVQVATSPISFDSARLSNAIESGQNKVAKITTGTVVVNTISDCLTAERSASPIETNNAMRSIFSPSGDKLVGMVIPAKNNNKASSDVKVMLTKTNEERVCLELNNSQNFCEENSNDCEIETIMQTMRLNYNLVTPIPVTPAKSVRESACRSITENQQTELRKHYVCPDAAELKEENKKLHASIADLAKEMMNIKNMLQNQILPQAKSVHSATELDCNSDNGDFIIFNNEIDTLNETERPSSVQTIIIEREKQSLIRSPSPYTQDPDTCHSNDLFVIQNPNNTVEKNNSLSTEVNNTPCLRLAFEDSTPFPVEFNSPNNTIIDVPDSNEMLNKCDTVYLSPNRRLKLSKLGKLKRKMIPKSKIRCNTKLTQKRKRLRPKPIIVKKKLKVLDGDNSASLNDKSIYEKAVKVMSEIKAKQSTDGTKCTQKVITIKSNESTHTNSILELINDIQTKPKSPTNTCIKKNITELKDMQNVNNNNECTPSNNIKNNSKDEALDINETSKPNEHLYSESNDISILSSSKGRVTRSRTKNSNLTGKALNDEDKSSSTELEGDCNSQNNDNENKCYERRTNLKRQSHDVEKSETPNKRILRSFTVHTRKDSKNPIAVEVNVAKEKDICSNTVKKHDAVHVSGTNDHEILNYNDLDIFSNDNVGENPIKDNCNNKSQEKAAEQGYERNVLCTMLQKYGVVKVSFGKKKVSDKMLNSISEKLEKDIAKIVELPPDQAKSAMDDLVLEIRHYKVKEFIYGLMKYLQDPTRKIELFKKVITPPAPAMSKSEQVLLYVITQLHNCWRSEDFVDKVLSSIEFALFAINRTPEFNAIESMSHFYAVLCRYFKAKSRLRLFILDAMYCLQFKSVPLIKQCIDVWMHIIPLAHMGLAKSPLVTCLVYLLHFYKCEDKFNRITEIRSILSRKYFFNITNWNESTILEMFRAAIMELKGNTLERKMLRISLIILAKRLGPRWCQKNIINNLLKPLIENNNLKENIRVFCITMMGPLLKPYPLDMKVHCEITMNELVDMLHRPASGAVQEAIVLSLLCLCRHNQNHVIQALLYWEPKEVSPELEDMLRNYVKTKPVKVWKSLLTNIAK